MTTEPKIPNEILANMPKRYCTECGLAMLPTIPKVIGKPWFNVMTGQAKVNMGIYLECPNKKHAWLFFYYTISESSDWEELKLAHPHKIVYELTPTNKIFFF